MPRKPHQDLDIALARLQSIEWDTFGRALHAALELEMDHPSRPDGFPDHTPGAEPATTITQLPTEGDCREIGCTQPRPCPDHDIPAGWTPVERAVVQRHHHHDRIARLVRLALNDLAAAVHNLDTAEAALHEITAERGGRRPANLEGCWALARVGGWAPVRATVEIGNRHVPLGDWAYRRWRATGEIPSRPECLAHMALRRVPRTKKGTP